MRALPAERRIPRSESIGLRTPTHADRLAERLAGVADGRSRAKPSLARGTDAAPALPARQAAYALLAEQCRSRIDGLSPRQHAVLAGLLAGFSNKEIARVLGISPRTVEIYRAGMMRRLKACTLAQALHIAFVAGLTPCDTMLLGSG